MRFPWPDTVALTMLFGIAAFLFLGGAILNAAHPFGPWWGAAFVIGGRLTLVIVAPVWIVLRGIDFLFAGPARRAERII